MEGERFAVRYIAASNCFAYLPDAWLRRSDTKDNVVAVLHGRSRYYFSCIPKHDTSEALCLGATFARSLDIKDGDEVFVASVKDVPSLSSITVVPRSKSDREILELQVEKLQSTLLNQIRVVAKDQAIVAWVSKFSSVTLITESLEPNFTYGKLEPFSEVRISDAIAPTEKRDGDTKHVERDAFNLRDAFKRIFPLSNEKINSEEEQMKNRALLHSFRNNSKSYIFCVRPVPKDKFVGCSDVEILLQCPYNVFVPKIHMPKIAKSENGTVICKLKKVPEDRQYVNVTNTNFLKNDKSPIPKVSSELTVKVYVLKDILKECSAYEKYFSLNCIHSNIYVSESLRISLRIKVGSKVIMQTTESISDTIPSSVDLFPLNKPVSAEEFMSYVERYSKPEKLLLNSCTAVIFDNDKCCIVRFSPENCTCPMINKADLKNLIIHERPVLDTNDLPILEDSEKPDFSLSRISMRFFENILTECHATLDLSLALNTPPDFMYDRENILLCGELGSGKTTICKILIENLEKPPYFVHTHMIDCRSLKGKKLEMMQKAITVAMSECVYYQPSVLFLDDLESITSASLNDEETTPDSINAARISDMLINVITQYQEMHYISVVATCNNISKIGQRLRPARGAHFFRTVIPVPSLQKTDRIDILQLTLGDKSCVPGEVNWDYYGNKTEGWMAQDLVDLAEKATFIAWKRHVKENLKPPIVITEEDMSCSLKAFTPMSLQGVNLYKGSGHVWSDIGGLADVKRSLIEILQWPLKYPEIFKNAPIKLQNGILLYGMPGTGKTMLAKAIANECGVNLISVKGPELLSKYIGVSEESVRNVFERARRAKPCVLFFDEFDSLAPRRGHDSTGVTDRVVNQLLTQLDGVEDREGVAVVAASSRPDLLDPALLRPGRLDKSLHCPLPNEVEREEILIALCRTQKINTEKLDLQELADITSGFTGADLNAAITQARLSAFEDALAAAVDGKVDASDIKVSQRQLVDSIKSTHPSLSPAEKLKYNRIYARFSKGDNFTNDILKNQKSTLA